MNLPANVEALRERGPLHYAELPTKTNGEMKIKWGIWKFNLTGTSGNGSTMGDVTPVYYLRSEHPPELVLRRWLDVNEEVLSKGSVTKWGLSQRLPDELRAVWRQIHTEDQYDFLGDAWPNQIRPGGPA